MIDLVARIERRHQRVEQHLLAAGADDDLVGRVVEIVLALELGDDRLLQLAACRRRRCIWSGRRGSPAIAASLMLSGVSKSGSPGAQADDVAARRLQLARLGGDRDGGGGLDAGETLGEDGHDRDRRQELERAGIDRKRAPVQCVRTGRSSNVPRQSASSRYGDVLGRIGVVAQAHDLARIVEGLEVHVLVAVAFARGHRGLDREFGRDLIARHDA